MDGRKVKFSMTLEILWNSGAKQILENIYKITEYELDNDRRLMFENENTNVQWASLSIDDIQKITIETR